MLRDPIDAENRSQYNSDARNPGKSWMNVREN